MAVILQARSSAPRSVWQWRADGAISSAEPPRNELDTTARSALRGADDGGMGKVRILALAASAGVLAAACSSSAPRPATGPGPAPPGGSAAVQQYLTAVNSLCDGLEQKINVLNGGQFDIPLKDYLAQLPQHTKLLDDFDRQLAAIVVPPAAAAKARALAAYIAFADKLDAARLRAARQGAAAYQREINAEQTSAASDPSIAARDAAGFSESCNAR
jgi:hypothetical protein